MAGYAWTGESGRVWIAVALGGALVDRRRRARWLWAALGVPLTLGVNFCVKRAVRRERPRLEGIEPAAAGARPRCRSRRRTRRRRSRARR